jgi:dTDP-glucose 4,6-dehydratase
MKTENKVEFRNLLVTGGCGFIGSNFIRYLINNKDFSGRIINADKLTYAGNPENLADIAADHASRYIFQKVDICDAAKLEDVFSRYDVDAALPPSRTLTVP